MKMLIRMAGRNLLRHRRRTLLTFLVLSFSAAVYVFYGCLLDGFTQQSFENMIAFESGHMRIADPREEDDPLSLSNTLPPAAVRRAENVLAGNKAVRSFTWRLHFQAEIDNQRDSTPCRITGLDPVTDRKVFPLHRLAPIATLTSNTAIIGAGLARDMGMTNGDTAYLTFRRKSGELESTGLLITALVQSGYPEVDNSTVFVSLKTAIRLSGASGPGEANIILTDPENAPKTALSLRKRLPGLRIQPWQEAGSGIVAMSEMKKSGSGAFVLFLSAIALVGIINTMLMSVLEKKKEIGTLKALGMRERDVRRLFLLEGTILGFFGALAGLLIGALSNIYFATAGINMQSILGDMSGSIGFKLLGVVRSSWDPQTFISAFLISILAAALASYLPARRAVRLEAAEALRTVQ